MPSQLVDFGGNFFFFKSGGGGLVFVFLLINSYARCFDLAERACEESKRDDVLTNKFDRLIEKGADISFVVVLDRDALVEEGVLKVVGAVGRHID